MTITTLNNIQRELNVTVLGAGMPLVMLHGGLGFDHSSFRPWLDTFAEDCQVVYFDHRGNGNAATPADWSAVSHTSMVDDIDRLRASLDAERMVLFGHSYGGFLALEYAIRQPERVAGLVLCNTGPTYRHLDRIIENVRRRATPDAFTEIMRWLASPADSDAALGTGIQPLLPLYFHAGANAGLVDEVFGRTRFRAAAFQHALSSLAPTYDVAASLAGIDVPTLVLVGDDDIIFPFDCGPNMLMSQLPQATLAQFDDCGHYPFAEQPERFRETLRAWLTKHGLVVAAV